MKTIKIIAVLISVFMFPAVICGANHFKDGNNYYLQGEYDKAIGEYSQFIQKQPKKYEGYYNAGDALFRQGQYDKALQMYNKALELNQKDEDVKNNIAVTEDRIKNQPQDKKQKNDKQDNQNKNGQQGQSQQGQNKQGQNQQGQNQQGKNQQGQNKQGQNQQGKSQQGQGAQPQEQAKQPPSGMSKDEVQALLNTMQNQEKQYRGYFGKQNNRPQNQGAKDLFNMSPEEIMQYMQGQMNDPNMTQQAPRGDSKEKDW
jgi:Ca-activated chloride channel family protein